MSQLDSKKRANLPVSVRVPRLERPQTLADHVRLGRGQAVIRDRLLVPIAAIALRRL